MGESGDGIGEVWVRMGEGGEGANSGWNPAPAIFEASCGHDYQMPPECVTL